ncbi:MAG: hypothetical protein M0Z28_16685 [Rhodospirillales bacterium]|nr:hypothetical protein [Rhodospirillales bacterium]
MKLEQAPDFKKTQELLALFADLRKTRRPLNLTTDEFDKVLRWKLCGQYGRTKKHHAGNSDELLRNITQCTFSISHDERDYRLQLRTGLLCVLRGVGVPVASAILALTHPEDYGVIDVRGWRQVFGGKRTQFSVSDYLRYMKELWRLADELGPTWSPQKVDYAIWVYDAQHSGI